MKLDEFGGALQRRLAEAMQYRLPETMRAAERERVSAAIVKRPTGAVIRLKPIGAVYRRLTGPARTFDFASKRITRIFESEIQANLIRILRATYRPLV